MKATDAMVILLDVIETPDQIKALGALLAEATENAYTQGQLDGTNTGYTEGLKRGANSQRTPPQ